MPTAITDHLLTNYNGHRRLEASIVSMKGNIRLLWRLYYLNKGDDMGYSADYMEIAHYVSWGVSCTILFRIRTGSWTTVNRRKRSKNAVLSPNVCWSVEVEYLHYISQSTLNLYILNFPNMFWSLPMGIHILDILSDNKPKGIFIWTFIYMYIYIVVPIHTYIWLFRSYLCINYHYCIYYLRTQIFIGVMYVYLCGKSLFWEISNYCFPPCSWMLRINITASWPLAQGFFSLEGSLYKKPFIS